MKLIVLPFLFVLSGLAPSALADHSERNTVVLQPGGAAVYLAPFTVGTYVRCEGAGAGYPGSEPRVVQLSCACESTGPRWTASLKLVRVMSDGQILNSVITTFSQEITADGNLSACRAELARNPICARR